MTGQLNFVMQTIDVGYSPSPRWRNGAFYVGIGTTSPSYQLQLSTDSAAKPTSNTWTIASDARIGVYLYEIL